MKINLIENDMILDYRTTLGENEIKFNFFKNIIKKDLEVVLWQNKAVKSFGEFQIYSDFRSELNSFDYIISFLTGHIFEYSGESVEAQVSCKCPEHFLNFLIIQNYNFDEREIDELAAKYTNYILEAAELLTDQSEGIIQDQIDDLNKKYFSENDPTTILNYLSSEYLN